MNFDIDTLAWEKMAGMIPAVVQDAATKTFIMLGYMNSAALQYTLETGWVTFFSRSKNRLWTKGEQSGNRLQLIDLFSDCDNDSLLVIAKPLGPTCHTGEYACFNTPLTKNNDWQWLAILEEIIYSRKIAGNPKGENSYTVQLFEKGLKRIAQKVGEEGVEVALAAFDENNIALSEEVADLLFHVMVLLREKDMAFSEVIQVLKRRHGV